MSKNSKPKRFDAAKEMPPLYHRLPGEEFSHDKSAVLKWVFRQPDIAQYVFDKLSKLGYIVYDPATGKWKGANYDN